MLRPMANLFAVADPEPEFLATVERGSGTQGSSRSSGDPPPAGSLRRLRFRSQERTTRRIRSLGFSFRGGTGPPRARGRLAGSTAQPTSWTDRRDCWGSFPAISPSCAFGPMARLRLCVPVRGSLPCTCIAGRAAGSRSEPCSITSRGSLPLRLLSDPRSTLVGETGAHSSTVVPSWRTSRSFPGRATSAELNGLEPTGRSVIGNPRRTPRARLGPRPPRSTPSSCTQAPDRDIGTRSGPSGAQPADSERRVGLLLGGGACSGRCGARRLLVVPDPAI